MDNVQKAINWRNTGTTPIGSWVANPQAMVSLHAIPAVSGVWVGSASCYNTNLRGQSVKNIICYRSFQSPEEAKKFVENEYRNWKTRQ